MRPLKMSQHHATTKRRMDRQFHSHKLEFRSLSLSRSRLHLIASCKLQPNQPPTSSSSCISRHLAMRCCTHRDDELNNNSNNKSSRRCGVDWLIAHARTTLLLGTSALHRIAPHPTEWPSIINQQQQVPKWHLLSVEGSAPTKRRVLTSYVIMCSSNKAPMPLTNTHTIIWLLLSSLCNVLLMQ